METSARPIIGLIVLDSDRNVIEQHRSMLSDRVRIETEPIELKNGIVTNASLAAMFDSDQLENAAKRLAEREAQQLVFCCTSGSLIHGPGWDQTLVERMESVAGIPASTTTTAVLAALRSIGARSLAIGTPYIAEIDEHERAFFEASGFTVTSIEGLGCSTDPDIAAVTPEQIVALGHRINNPDTDTIFLSCTTLNVAGSIDRLESELDKPVITSNQATSWLLLQNLGIAPQSTMFGTLMTGNHELASS